MTSPVKTLVQIYYRPAGTGGYSEKASVAREVKPGFNELFVELPFVEMEGRLRFDPGFVPGEYRLHALDVLRFDGQWSWTAGKKT
jgi:hypothetical protein